MNIAETEFARGLRSLAPHDFDFGDALAESDAALRDAVAVPLLQRATIRVAGEDRDAFLQGQLSSDLRALDDTRAQWSTYNSPKGRMLALPILRRTGEAVLLDLPAGLADATVARLRRHVLRSHVTLDVVRSDAAGVAGPAAAAALVALGLPVPGQVMSILRHDRLVVTRLPGDPPRFTVHATPERIAHWWPTLSQHLRPAGTNAWTLLQVLAGLPEVHPETSEHFIPQHAGLDDLGALAWDKGCYTGQEVIARLHYRGEAKRGLHRLRSKVPAPRGATIEESGGRQAGEVVDCARHPDGGARMTAILRQDAPGPWILRDGGAEVQLDDPPGG